MSDGAGSGNVSSCMYVCVSALVLFTRCWVCHRLSSRGERRDISEVTHSHLSKSLSVAHAHTLTNNNNNNYSAILNITKDSDSHTNSPLLWAQWIIFLFGYNPSHLSVTNWLA